MCFRNWIVPLIWEIFVLMASSCGVAVSLCILTRYMEQSSIAQPNIPNTRYEPLLIGTGEAVNTPKLVASVYDSKTPTVSIHHMLSIPSFQNNHLQFEDAYNYSTVSSKASFQENESTIGGRELALVIPSILLESILSSGAEDFNSNSDKPRSGSNNINTHLPKIDKFVIVLSIFIWLNGIFFNRFANALAEKLKRKINRKSVEG